MCIVGMFGTTNTGAIDDIRVLRDIADREGMWLHADAAYGGGMLLSRDFAMRDAGLNWRTPSQSIRTSGFMRHSTPEQSW